ncbi:px domain-containing protein [Colletotrichum musicola]|uniref:Px domain-containing protein n=1 Tax=Colletotrichum musicola TaxID=2175873 RepID=A0A8H6K8I2_9PEZI|nr:px domain-containing protein [Colletotrichum musicola]
MASSKSSSSSSTSTTSLSADQIHALFNILTHHETYREIRDFRHPETISNYGYPFAAAGSRAGDTVVHAPESSAPLLQSLFTRFILTLPGVSSIAPEFWNVRVQGLLEKLASADLSESYEKGQLGTRKTLATASSTVIEALARGTVGGAPFSDPATRPAEYDIQNAEHLARAWDDSMHGLVYEDLCDELLDFLAETEEFDTHSSATKAACDYILVHLATLCHQVLIVSPEGQYLVKLMDSVHKMVPYGMVRQTLKIGNAATMIAGMMKIFLAKIGVGSVSNWFGLTSNAADGQNLLQRIISVILGWDCAEFKKTVDRISKAKDGPSKGALDAIRAHCQAPQAERDAVRDRSLRESRSVVAVILDEAGPGLLEDASEGEHAQCLEFYAALLAIRDREEIISVLCRQTPDLLTQAIREAVAGMDPIIRAVHNKVDLSDHVKDYHSFVDQLINTSKPRKAKSKDELDPPPPTVEDYVQLLKNNRRLLYKFLHAVAKNCPGVMDQFRKWAKESLTAFHKEKNGASIETKLGVLFARVPEQEKAKLVPVIDAHAAYLRELDDLSRARMQAIIEGNSSSMAGPGVYLVRWQSLLDETLVTPATPAGPIRHGKEVQGSFPQGKRGSVSSGSGEKIEAVRSQNSAAMPEAPDVTPVVEAVGPLFRQMIATVGAAPRTNGYKTNVNGNGDGNGNGASRVR